MATIKITQLPTSSLSANTSNTVFVVVDTNTGITSKVTETQIADNLYANNILNVGGRPQLIPNVVAQFASTDPLWLDVTNQNFHANGSSDFVAVSNVSETGFENYIDMGINNSNYHDETYSSMKATDGYLYTSGINTNTYSGNLVIGTATSNAKIILIAGGTTSNNIVVKVDSNQINILRDVIVTGNVSTSGHFTFSDSTQQSTAASPIDFSQASFVKANTAINNAASASFYANTGIVNASVAGTYANTAINNAASASFYANTANSWIQSNYLANTNNVILGGNLNINGYSKPTKGIVFTPKIMVGSQTAYTLDQSLDSIVKLLMSDTLTITHSNFITGKVTELWVTNTSSSSQSFIHGCSEINSTSNNTTFVIPSTSTIHAKYISFDTTLANTFVSITHA